MAASNDDILTVAQVKAELRIPTGTDSQDALIQSQIDAAIAFISNEQASPLVDQTETIQVEPATGDSPLVFGCAGLKSVTEIRYWTPAASLRDAPDGTIVGSDLGRVVADRRQPSVYGPGGGWPQTLDGSRIEIVFIRGTEDSKLPAYRAAVTTAVRHLYDGFREIRPTESFVRLSRSLRG